MKWQRRKRTYFLGEIGNTFASIHPAICYEAPICGREAEINWCVDVLGLYFTTVLGLKPAMEAARQELKQRAYAMIDVAANAAKDEWEEWTP